MRYIIHGAGAIGSLTGGRLAESGAEVALIARAAHAAAINERGLTIRAKKGDRRVTNLTAVSSPEELAPRPDDVILLTVKSGQTAGAVQALREVFAEQTPVFCLQNGVRNEEIAARRFLRVYGAMAGISATLLEPGLIAHTMGYNIGLGNYPLGHDETVRAVADDLSHAGFKVTTHESVMAVKWSKLILNLNNAVLAITDCYVQLSRVLPRVSRFLAEVEEEGLHVLSTAGISVSEARNPYDLTARIAEMRNLAEDAEAIRQAESLPFELRTYPSTWVDLKRKRGETEAGYFNGEIILLGEKHGVPTPYNSSLLNIVERMAAERVEPGLYTIDDLAELVEQRRRELYRS
jgi:2-dehydropantoate 2-reductase